MSRDLVSGAVWADPNTLRGKVERMLEGIISGGASSDDIDDVVINILSLIESEIRGIE